MFVFWKFIMEIFTTEQRLKIFKKLSLDYSLWYNVTPDCSLYRMQFTLMDKSSVLNFSNKNSKTYDKKSIRFLN